jgi:hypothetical protein
MSRAVWKSVTGLRGGRKQPSAGNFYFIFFSISFYFPFCFLFFIFQFISNSSFQFPNFNNISNITYIIYINIILLVTHLFMR